MSTRTRSDWILWAQLGCALVATAHAEYTLALATGLHWVVASAVPGALDLYVIRALQKHKDVLPAVLVMVAANVASILVSARVLPLHWGLYSAVGALVPLLVWRGHVLRAHEVQAAGAVSAPEYTAPEPSTPPGTDADWLPQFLADQVHPVLEPSTPVPPLPPEYEPEFVQEYAIPASAALLAGDYEYMGSALAYLAECDEAGRTPSIRGLKEFGHMNQDRAKRLLAHLKETQS